MRYVLSIIIVAFLLFIAPPVELRAENDHNIHEERLALYNKTETLTQIPWYYFAAIDQYERNIQTNKTDDKLISIHFPLDQWYGIGNKDHLSSQTMIHLFDGLGADGNGDQQADHNDPEDILYTMGQLILQQGQTKDDIKIALFNHYERDLAVQTIMNTAKVFQKTQKIELPKRKFPLSMNYHYSYQNTWGDRRGFGGLRIHEGTDVFADYGTPVQSTTYGVIELKGWNLYGGWRIGIRDINNVYHYFAHLHSYNDDVKVGDVVQPGDLLGTVGSSGYGPPGTSGKFPPHLHYGMYQDNGYNEWSFDPYPFLKRWERMTEQHTD